MARENKPSMRPGTWTFGSKVAIVCAIGTKSATRILYLGVTLGSAELALASSLALPFNLWFALPDLLSDSI
jgi:hypothetical protein